MLTLKPAFISLVMLFAFAEIPGNCQDNVKVQLTKSNFLYRNSENPATISVPGTAQKDIKITIDNGSIVTNDKGFIIKPSKLGTAVVSVFVKDKLLKKLEFKVVDILVKLNGHKSGDIEKSILLTNPKLTAELEGAESAAKFNVVSFDVSAMIEGNEVSFEAKGDALTSEQINLIKKLASGDVLMISGIKVMGPDGEKRSAADMLFTLK